MIMLHIHLTKTLIDTNEINKELVNVPEKNKADPYSVKNSVI